MLILAVGSGIVNCQQDKSIALRLEERHTGAIAGVFSIRIA